ncbi:hypothetical protein DAI22_07g075900 [Oryza sativa Japonica Group]|nr:hypothetical protein DAI22_07g075900 [Oryza sativa Japonica Group]
MGFRGVRTTASTQQTIQPLSKDLVCSCQQHKSVRGNSQLFQTILALGLLSEAVCLGRKKWEDFPNNSCI